MRIPFITHAREEAQLKNEYIQAETVLIKKQTEAIEGLNEVREKALTAVAKFSSTPTMTLNQELYGGDGRPYQSTIWNSSHKQARRLSRIAEYDSPAAQAMIGRFVDMVIGPKLNLQASPIWPMLPGSPAVGKPRQDFVKNIETRWKLWGNKKSVTHNRQHNYYTLSRKIFEDLLIDGEYFILNRYSSSRKRNPLTLQYICPDDVIRMDSRVNPGNDEIDGIEYDKDGVAVAYHVIANRDRNKSVRIPTTGTRSGRTFMIHNTIGRGRRGVGILAGIITELTKLADFQALEIQAAVINALFAVWVETEIGGDVKPLVNKEGIQGVTKTAPTKQAFNYSEFEAKLSKTAIDQGGIIAQSMGEGQKLHSFDTKRPTANFEQFFKSTLRNLFSAKGASYAMVMYDANGSYSATRGEFLLAWKRVMTLRLDHSTDFDSVIYQMWLWGEVDRGKITMQGWEDEETRDAWSNSKWPGPARPDIDPMRSAKAHEMESVNGWKTDNFITSERGGGDWDENSERKLSENEIKAEFNKPIVELDKTTFSNSKNVTESTTKTEEG